MLLSILFFTNENRFLFWFLCKSLDIFSNGNLFGHATLKGDFFVLDFDDTYNNTFSIFVSYFGFHSESSNCHTQLGHVCQDRMSKLAKTVF